MLRIAFLASELTPFAKTGGLADVAEALPRTLGKLGHDVRVFVPLYGSIDGAAHGLEPVEVSTEGFALRKGMLPRSSVPVYFIDAPRFFAREAIYTNDEDEPFRFLFFCRAVLEACHHLAFVPEIFHLNDWQTALVPLLLKRAASSLFDKAKTLFTIHNLAYQGVFSAEIVKAIGIEGPSSFDARDSKDGIVNFLKTGLVHADHLSTVSPTYAEEIQTSEQGYGLDALLRRRRAALVGILNGVDYETWSPANDTLIPFRYTEKNLDGKNQNKKALLKELSLSQPEDVPLVGMVTRLSAQKGLDSSRALVTRVLVTRRPRHRRGAIRRVFCLAPKRLPRSPLFLSWLSQPARALDRGGGGHVSHAFPLRALWSQSDVQPQIWDGSYRAQDGRSC